MNYKTFETEVAVRPADIDLHGHVHSPEYLSYFLTARFEQMRENYGISMREFQERGYSWFIRRTEIDYRKPLGLGDRMIVRSRIDEVSKTSAWVAFEILEKESRDVCCQGRVLNVLVKLDTGRPARIPDWAVASYSVLEEGDDKTNEQNLAASGD